MGGKALNFNIGMLGHVDSGKTSLAKALSSISSTAAFDKNPQSKERGITLDLGFSSFQTPAPQHLEKFDQIQYTLVDCPGHASLIKTIIGGAQIIDLMILVVDVTKGIQTQTAECLIIGEIICPKILVVLNKIDLLPEAKRQASIDKMSKKMMKTLERTKFKCSASVVAVAAHPGGENVTDDNIQHQGMENLIQVLQSQTYEPDRSSSGPFIFSVDHCFSIRGQGTVMTGTVLSGRVQVNDVVEIANLQITRKVKSMQMFRQPITTLQQGDRGACCVTQFDPKSLERGIVCTPGAMTSYYAAIAEMSKIEYYSGQVESNCRYHVTVGHVTVMCKITLFTDDSGDDFQLERSYKYKNGLDTRCTTKEFGLLEFEKAIICSADSLMIGSKLDVDVNTSKCRLAFKARMLKGIEDKDFAKSFLPKLLIYKMKEREGIVERIHDDYTVICKNLMKKETNMEIFLQLKVQLSTGESGFIEGTFGQSGKTKIRIPDGLSPSTREMLGNKKKKNKNNNQQQEQQQQQQETIKVLLKFRRYIYDPSKSMKQI